MSFYSCRERHCPRPLCGEAARRHGGPVILLAFWVLGTLDEACVIEKCRILGRDEQGLPHHMDSTAVADATMVRPSASSRAASGATAATP